MATSGTITGVFGNEGDYKVTITGILQASSGPDTPSFSLKNYTESSYVVSGTFGSGGSLQWYGSNDEGVTWIPIGSPITAAIGGTLTAGQVFYGRYKGTISGGDGTTNLSAYVRAVIPR